MSELSPDAVASLTTLIAGVMLGFWVMERVVAAVCRPLNDHEEQALDRLYPSWSTILKHVYLSRKGQLPQGIGDKNELSWPGP